MRLPSIFSEVSFSFRRLRTTPARKPRTECFCQPVAFIIPAMVAPPGACSIATTRDCFELGSALSVLALAGFWAAFAAGAGAVEDKVGFLLADAVIEILRLVRFTAASRRIAEAPPRPLSRRGRIPNRQWRSELATVPL